MRCLCVRCTLAWPGPLPSPCAGQTPKNNQRPSAASQASKREHQLFTSFLPRCPGTLKASQEHSGRRPQAHLPSALWPPPPLPPGQVTGMKARLEWRLLQKEAGNRRATAGL